MSFRPPPDQTQPFYARLLPRYKTASNLRPAVLLVAFFSAVYGLFQVASVVRRRNNGHLSSKLDTTYLVLAIMYASCVAIEVYGIFAAWTAKIKLVTWYFVGSASAALIVTAAELLRLIVHFTDKSAIQAACLAGEQADQIRDGGIQLSDDDLRDYCYSAWRSATYFDIALLIFSVLLGFLFASLAGSYLYQLKNPQSMRVHVATTLAPSSAYSYPLQSYPPNPYGGAGYPQQQPYAAPPYAPHGAQGSLPAYDNPSGYELPREKGDDSTAKDPFNDQGGMTSAEYEQRQHDEEVRRRAAESTDTVTLEPRREGEGRV